MKRPEWLILIGLLLLSLIPCVGGSIRLIEILSSAEFGFLPENPRIGSAPTPVILHLISSVPYCILGAFQFLPSFRNAYPKWHRLIGRFLVLAGIVSALSGLWMTHSYSFPASLQGELLYGVRIIVGLAMIASIYLGLTAIRMKRFSQHKAWMIRAYALGQGAGTQVMISIPWFILFGESTGLTRDILMTLGWLINLALAEIIIHRKSNFKATLSIRSPQAGTR